MGWTQSGGSSEVWGGGKFGFGRSWVGFRTEVAGGVAASKNVCRMGGLRFLQILIPRARASSRVPRTQPARAAPDDNYPTAFLIYFVYNVHPK